MNMYSNCYNVKAIKLLELPVIINIENHMTDKSKSHEQPKKQPKEQSEKVEEQTENTADNEENLSLEELVHKLQDEIEQGKDKYLRLLAELENLKKHSAKQISDASHYAIGKFAKELLPVWDVFTKALEGVKDSKIIDNQFKSFVEGVNLTKQALAKVFKQFDIQELGEELVGKPFDPNHHEALLNQDHPELENDTVSQVLETGFTIKEKLLRPAKVAVVKK